MAIGGCHDDRIAAPHFRMQQAHRIALGIVGAERVGAHQLGQTARKVSFGAALGAHFVKHHRNAGAGQLPGRLATREAATNNVDGVVCGLIHDAPNVMRSATKLKTERNLPGKTATRRKHRQRLIKSLLCVIFNMVKKELTI